MRRKVAEPLVYLVRDQVKIMLHGKLGNGRQILTGLHRSRRIRGRAEQDRFCSWRDSGRDPVRVQAEAIGPAGGNGYRRTASQAHARRIRNITRFRDQHLLAWGQQGAEGQVKSFRHTGGDETLVCWPVAQAVAAIEVRADGLAKFQQACVGRIGGDATFEGEYSSFPYPPGGRVVRLAHSQRDNIFHAGRYIEEAAYPRRRAGNDGWVQRPHGATLRRWSSAPPISSSPSS